MRPDPQLLDATLLGNGTGAAFNCAFHIDKWIKVKGTFTATVTIEISIDNGATWDSFLAVTAASAITKVEEGITNIRVVVSGWGSGQAAVAFFGRNTKFVTA